MAKQLQTLLANFDDSSVFGFNLVSQILNPFFLASLVSLSQVLFPTRQSSNTAVLNVLFEHFKFLHVFFKALARILPQLGLAAASSPGKRLRIAQLHGLSHSFLADQLRVFFDFIIAILQICFAFAMVAFGFVLFGHFETATEVGARLSLEHSLVLDRLVVDCVRFCQVVELFLICVTVQVTSHAIRD